LFYERDILRISLHHTIDVFRGGEEGSE